MREGSFDVVFFYCFFANSVSLSRISCKLSLSLSLSHFLKHTHTLSLSHCRTHTRSHFCGLHTFLPTLILLLSALPHGNLCLIHSMILRSKNMFSLSLLYTENKRVLIHKRSSLMSKPNMLSSKEGKIVHKCLVQLVSTAAPTAACSSTD